jgi:hypothetical protein
MMNTFEASATRRMPGGHKECNRIVLHYAGLDICCVYKQIISTLLQVLLVQPRQLTAPTRQAETKAATV